MTKLLTVICLILLLPAFGTASEKQSDDPFDLANAVTIYGLEKFDDLGESITPLGDFNGDGFNDFAIGLPGDDGNTSMGGEVSIIFGRSDFPSQIEQTDLDGITGVLVTDTERRQGLGQKLTGGDFNGDGLGDLAITEINALAFDSFMLPQPLAGRVWVVFGRNNPPATINLSDLLQENGGDGSAGFIIEGTYRNNGVGSGLAVADMNADGRQDLIVGTFGGNRPAETFSSRLGGEVQVIYGRPSNQPFAPKYLPADSDTFGSVILGSDPFDAFGVDLSSGDFNGDGFRDIAVLASGGDGAGNNNQLVGEVVIVYARSDFPTEFDTTTLTSGSNQGQIIYGSADELFFTTSPRLRTGTAGDVDGNGFDDLLMGELRPIDTSFLYYTSASNQFAELSALEIGQGIRFTDPPGQSGTDIGSGVSTAGDFNNDGFADIVLGIPGTRGIAGDFAIFYGSTTRLTGPLTAADADVLVAGNGRFGKALASVGDVNGDGIDDLAIGAPNADGIEPNSDSAFGRVYLFFGFDQASIPGNPSLWMTR